MDSKILDMRKIINPSFNPQTLYNHFGIRSIYRYRTLSYQMKDENHAVRVLNEQFGANPNHKLLSANKIIYPINLKEREGEFFLFTFKDNTTMWCTKDEFGAISHLLINSKERVVRLWYELDTTNNFGRKGEGELHILYY